MLRTRLMSLPRWQQIGLIAALVVCVVVPAAWGIGRLTQYTPPPVRAELPSQQIWKDGASSLLFGTNDTYEWSTSNIETSPGIQNMLRAAGFTLVRSFFPDGASDSVIDLRATTISQIGAQCLGVITNINNTTFDEHLVAHLGDRCLMYEIGNEPDYTNVSVQTYLQRWNTLVPLLRRINPHAKFIGPVTSTPEGKNGFMRAFLEGVASSHVLPDALSFHWYPCWRMSRDDCLGLAGSAYDATLDIRRMVHDVLGKDLPVGITEWNYDPGNPPPAYGDEAAFMTSFTNTAIAAMARAGAAFACQFDAASYGGFGRLDMFNINTGQPKPQFLALRALIAAYRPAGAPTPGGILAGSAYGPLVSRGKTTVCTGNDAGAGGTEAVTDEHYGNFGFWRTSLNKLPAWCAIQVGRGPSSVLVTWNSDYIFDYLSARGMEPADYTIAVSGDSTDGSDGTWQTVAAVQGNTARLREHLVPFAGKSWVKMTVTRGQATPTQPYVTIDEISVYDVSHGLNDTFLFSGDSSTATAYNQFDENRPSFSDLVHQAHPGRFPPMLDEGVGGWTSDDAAREIDTLLALNPDIHYWLLGWGTNDALAGTSPAHFQQNMQMLVAKIRAAGHVPVLAHIPYVAARQGAAGAQLDAEVHALNAAIDQVTAANGLQAGPDLYTLFKEHAAAYLSSDGINPTPQGSIAMNAAWLAALRQDLGL